MRTAIQLQNRRRTSSALSMPLTRATNPASLRMSSTPSSGTPINTATSAIDHRDQAGLAESADQIGLRELQGNERYAGGGMGEHAGRTDNEQGIAKGGNLSSPASRRSRAAKVNCMLSEKLMTMMSGVITFKKHV